MTAPGTDQLDLTVETVQGLVDNARRLGLVWDLRYAQVLEGSNPASIKVNFDGDAALITAQVPCISLIGPLNVDQRVAVIAVPPAGQYIVGKLLAPPPGKFIGLNYDGQHTTTTYTTEAFHMTYTLPVNTPLYAGQTYLIKALHFEYLVSTGANEAILRIRVGNGTSVTASDTQLASLNVAHQLVFTPVSLVEGLFTPTATGQYTFGLSAAVWTGSAPGVSLKTTFLSQAYMAVYTA